MKKSVLIPFLLTLVSPLALAHPGHLEHHSFGMGWMHPITGLDHLSVMIAVGVLAALFGGSAQWKMPLAFVSIMVFSGLASVLGWVVPGVEIAIAASVVIMGLMLISGTQLSTYLVISLIMIFAVFHGSAHGIEMPFNTQTWQYFLGFTLSTLLLHILGIFIGKLVLTLLTHRIYTKVTGVIMALFGSTLFFS